jgi:soluble lytic murein transglycosylase
MARRSARVTALACAGLLTLTCIAGVTATTVTAHAKAAKHAGKKAKSAAKSTTKSAAKSKEKKKSESHEAATAPSGPLDPRPEPLRAETLPPASVPEIADADVAMVKKAIEGLHSGGTEKATQIEAGIPDPAAHKLVEWIILRNANSTATSTRYRAFIAANPSWPSLALFRRRAEEMLWAEHAAPAQVLAFFKESPPQSAKGRLVLARALLVQGDTEGAKAQVREAWRHESMSADVESQVLKSHSELLTRADHKARMESRLFAGDKEAAMRAAHRLGGADVAIARARIAVSAKGGNGSKLLEAVPAEAHHDPGYIFARVHLLRHQKKITEAAQAMLSAPDDLAQVCDGEEWWVERRVLSRELLDIGDARSAYLVVRDAAEPVKENSRVERHFMAGWIALRYLNDPATAATHFSRIADVSIHPTSLARSHYWLGRTAEAAHRLNEARAEYQAAARASAAYYGQLARARLGLGALALAPPPPAPDKGAGGERLELVGAAEILYALNERALAISFMSDIGDRLNDAGVLSALGGLTEQHQDARAMLHLGKAALARGLPLDYYAFPAVGVPRYSPIGPGIDTALLFAIIRQESAFDPADTSAAHAMGLMQVTPVAARDTCKRFGCKYDAGRLKNDSPYNLQLGAAELGCAIEEYRGNYILAFAAYNAGRGRVQEWIAKFGDPRNPKVDPVDWVERIPIMETRNYVQRVMENTQVYRTRFGRNAPLTIESDLRGRAAHN